MHHCGVAIGQQRLLGGGERNAELYREWGITDHHVQFDCRADRWRLVDGERDGEFRSAGELQHCAEWKLQHLRRSGDLPEYWELRGDCLAIGQQHLCGGAGGGTGDRGECGEPVVQFVTVVHKRHGGSGGKRYRHDHSERCRWVHWFGYVCDFRVADGGNFDAERGEFNHRIDADFEGGEYD